MPPQRRKIVPPSTMAKGRRPKVAGTSAKSTEPSDASATDASATDASATDTAGIGTTGTETSATGTAQAVGGGAAAKSAPTKAAAPGVDETPDQTARRVELTKSSVEAPTAGISTAGISTTDISATDTPATSTPAGTADGPEAQAAHDGEDSWPSWRLVSIVGAVAVVLAVFAVVAALQPGSKIEDRAWVDQSATSEVTAAATNAIQTLYTYKADTIDADFDKARAVLNPQMLDEFNKTADTTKSAVVQTKTGTDASLTDIGVTRLESDKAELLVNMNVSATTDGVAQGSAEGPLTVNMEKIDGTWLLSAIDDQ